MMVGMFVIVGCGYAVIGEPDDPVFSNRAPNAPVLIQEKSNWEKECYTYAFYAEDPDGDQLYYEIVWRQFGGVQIVSCSPDEPVKQWLGPFESGKEIDYTHYFNKVGTYELTIRAKDIHDSIGPSTTITVTYKSNLSQFPLLSKLLDKYPEIFNLLTKLF